MRCIYPVLASTREKKIVSLMRIRYIGGIFEQATAHHPINPLDGFLAFPSSISSQCIRVLLRDENFCKNKRGWNDNIASVTRGLSRVARSRNGFINKKFSVLLLVTLFSLKTCEDQRAHS